MAWSFFSIGIDIERLEQTILALHPNFKESVKIKNKIYSDQIISIASMQNLIENKNLIIRKIGLLLLFPENFEIEKLAYR